MRILLDYRPALRQRTGVGQYVHEIASALRATAPADESLVLFSSSWRDRLDTRAVPGATTVDRRIPVSLLNLAWHRFGWPPVEHLTRSAFDVVQGMHPLIVPSSRAARLITIHDLDFLDHPERTRAEIRRDYRPLAAAHARRADGIIAVSSHTAEAVVTRLGVPPSRVTICHPGAPAWPRRPAEPATDGYLLFLGTLAPRKNLGVLLDAYAQLLDRIPAAPRLVLAGGSTPDAEPLLARLELPPLAGRVEVTGYVDEARKPALYRDALLFVLPSHTEGFGMTVLEAMATGVPVIAANRGALPEAVGRAGLLIDPDDAAGLADVLQALLGDPARRQRMSEDGWRQAQRFTWIDAAGRMRAAWTRALHDRQARRD